MSDVLRTKISPKPLVLEQSVQASLKTDKLRNALFQGRRALIAVCTFLLARETAISKLC